MKRQRGRIHRNPHSTPDCHDLGKKLKDIKKTSADASSLHSHAYIAYNPSLRGIGARNGLRHLGDLVAGADDALAGRVGDVGDVLVLLLDALPDLDLAAAAEDADAHGGQEVVSGVGVVVDAAVEDGGGVFANGRRDEGLAAGVVLDEVGDVVDDAGDGDEGLAVLGVGDKVVPADDG